MYPEARSLTRFFWSFIRKQPLPFIVFFLAPTCLILEVTVLPYAIKMIIDGITTHSGPRTDIFQKLSPILWLYGLSWFLLVGVIRLQNWWQAYVIPKFEADIRMSSLAYVLGHSYRYFGHQFSGNLGNKIRDLPKALNDIRMILSWNIISTTSIAIATLCVMAIVNLWCALVLALWIITHVFVVIYFGRFTNKKSAINAEDKSRLSGSVVDVLSNIASVKLFSKAAQEINYIAKQQAEEIKSNIKLIIAESTLRLFMDIPVAFMMAGLLYSLIVGWQRDLVTAGDVAFVTQSAYGLMNHMWFLGDALIDLFRQVGVAEQALTILRDPHDIVDVSHAKTLKVSKGQIEFDNVTFHYHGGNQLFKNKDIIIEPGAKVGLVGFSGSGKTTFVNLILRFFDVHSGEIRIDGQNIHEVTQDSLHAAIAMIPQDTSLFHRTLMENIRYGKPSASDEEVIRSSVHAHCHEFIGQLPEGYQTLVGERGMKLSGGQRQRIAIARAILKNAPIVILDEATSALDSVTEQLIQESLQTLMEKRTTIVIAHRLSTLAAMDRILVFDKGRIVEEGSHEELLEMGGRYAHMWHMQAGGFLPEKE